jgi:hypothetical protein
VAALGVFQLNTTLRGTLSGTIKNTAGAALPGMTVTARVNGSVQSQITTTSAADGTWAFTGLDVGAGRPYSLSFTDLSGTYLPLDYDAAPSTPDTPDMVKVVAGQTTTVADVVLHHDATRPTTAALNSIKMRTQSTAKLKFRVKDAYGHSARLTLVVATTKGKVMARVNLGVRAINITDATTWRPSGLAPGKYTWWITATDLAGNTQSSIVTKAIVLTR